MTGKQAIYTILWVIAMIIITPFKFCFELIKRMK